MVELDALDLEILRILMKNCRKSAREIARELGKSPTIIAKKVRKLEELGVVKSCKAVVDVKKLGFGITALIMLNVEGAHIEEVERVLANEPNVRGVYDITGEF
ncbi:MAG TPA: Lrp/AsnC family transcriptional regulator, partial [Ignisphaera aggregans]|nr:Lrp/AsnC family transcriptional regulator [Ignisphaera aggregans]